MKINEVEKATGITCANIRYYERKELLVPERGNENNYRVYNSDDIERLKQIKILRMMGISIAEIKDIFDNSLDLKATISQRIAQLEEEEKSISAVKDLCNTILEYDMDVSMLNEELLKENTELWKQKLSNINLEEKARNLSRKTNLFLCILSIILSFFPLMPYEDKTLNIIQALLNDAFVSDPGILIPLLLYMTIPVIYTYMLYSLLHYKYSLTMTYSSNMAIRVVPVFSQFILAAVVNSYNLDTISSASLLICMIYMLLRIFVGFLLLVCYASGEELFIRILKNKATN